MTNLDKTIVAMSYENLIAGLNPPVKVSSGIVAGLAAGEMYKRGTALARDPTDGKLYILGTATPAGLTADSILAQTIEIGTADTVAEIYTAGCFSADALTVATGYTITPADKAVFKGQNIYLEQAMD